MFIEWRSENFLIWFLPPAWNEFLYHTFDTWWTTSWIEEKVDDTNRKILDTSGLVKERINEIKGKIPSITGLATTSTLNTLENKIPIVSDVIKKTNCDAKISHIRTKYFTTSDYDRFAEEILHIKIKEKGLVDISDISGFIGNSDLD